MLGGHLSNQGGIASVQQQYFNSWDYSGYDLRHLATYGSGSQLGKLLMAMKASVVYVWTMLIWRPAIVHLHFSDGVSIFRKSSFVALGKVFGKKIVLHCHASSFDVLYDGRGRVLRRFIEQVLDLADLLLVLSNSWKAYFERLPLTVPIQVLHNPVKAYFPESQASGMQPVALTLGKLGERKGTYDILDAIPLILEHIPNAEFWLGGDGELERIGAILDEVSWGKQVRLLGWVKDDQKELALSSASLFLLPSYHEGLPVAILEAMIHGLPVVSTPVGGIPEVVLEGETGFLVEPGDVRAIAQKTTLVLQDESLRQEMGNNARKLAKAKFESGQILQQLYEIYDNLLADQGRVASS